MEFTQNLPPIRGGYVYKNKFFHVGASKILVEMCWRAIGMAAIQLVSNG